MESWFFLRLVYLVFAFKDQVSIFYGPEYKLYACINTNLHL